MPALLYPRLHLYGLTDAHTTSLLKQGERGRGCVGGGGGMFGRDGGMHKQVKEEQWSLCVISRCTLCMCVDGGCMSCRLCEVLFVSMDITRTHT